MVIEQACYLADEIDRQRRTIRKAGTDTRVTGSQGQPVSCRKSLTGNATNSRSYRCSNRSE